MERHQEQKNESVPKELFEDMIGNPLRMFIMAYQLKDKDHAENCKNVLRNMISEFRIKMKYLRMSYFDQWLTDIDENLHLFENGNEKKAIDNLKKIWDDFREKTKNAGVV